MSPTAINLSLSELFQMAYDSDNELARTMARRFEAEFPGNLETVEEDLASVEDIKGELESLRKEHTDQEKQIELLKTSLAMVVDALNQIPRKKLSEGSDTYQLASHIDQLLKTINE
jgi:septal ring factor EnvC (AmiA/AmiB activator)